MNRFPFILISAIFLAIFCFGTVNAQETMVLKDSTYLKEKDYSRQYDYENFLYPFAPKKKNMWALGINGGHSFIYGDIRSELGYGGGLTVQKGLGHVMSLRFQGLYSINKGLDWEDNGATVAQDFRNYKTSLADLQIQGVFHFNNVNFYKRYPKFQWYVLAGAGATARMTQYDLEDGSGNPYSYDAVDLSASKSDILDDLRNIHDGDYETNADISNATATLGDNMVLLPSVGVGVGMSFKLGKRVDLNLEHRVSWHNSDLLDGSARTIEGTRSEVDDLMHYSSIGFNFKIGDKTEPLWWLNPLVRPYDDIMNLKNDLYKGEFLKDDDDDGVIDVFDKDLNTPPNQLVTTKGVAIDLDGDGISDHLDAQPFTPKGAITDKNGVAVDGDNDGVADIFDKELSSPVGALVDAKGYEIKAPETDSMISSSFDIVYFDFNSSVVKKEFYPTVYDVAQYLKANPSAKIKVVGNADNRASDKYNIELSKKRAQKVADLLVKAFEISENRLIIKFKGEENPVIKGLKDKVGLPMSQESEHYLNRRVNFVLVK